MSHKEARKGLNKIADELGRNRLARDIEPIDVLNVLRPIYERGKKAMADHVRSYVRSAYSWGMKSENDYRSTSPRRFNLVSNPAAGIPTEPKKPGERWLREDEWVKMWRWLQNPDSLTHESYPLAIMLLMLTGQRVQEICTLHKDQYDAEEGIIDWHKTKNGRPHAIPLPSLAKELLDSITPNEHGWYFPGQKESVNVCAAPDSIFLPVAAARPWRYSARHQQGSKTHIQDPGGESRSDAGNPRPAAEPRPL